MSCFTAQLPLCDNCIEALTPSPWSEIYAGACALNFFADNIAALKHEDPDEVRRVLIVMARHNRYPRHIAFVLKDNMPDKYEWFQRLLLLL